MKGYIYLEDGTKLTGKSFGAAKTVIGELVFYTGMTGYQDVLTDPSYGGQIVVMTYPMVGNYGISHEDREMEAGHTQAIIVREYTPTPNHYGSEMTLDEFMKEQGIPGIYDVDTRMLTKKIREKGTMTCLISTEEHEDYDKMLQDYGFPVDLVEKASQVRGQEEFFSGSMPKIGILDLGVKQSIIDDLKARNVPLTFYPYGATKDDVLKDKVSALLLSSGPGNPKDCKEAIALAKELIGRIPLWGIGLGHEVLALAVGGNTYKMKQGHRGNNYPVYDKRTGKLIISSQNHGYAVEEESLPFYALVTHANINDNTVEGFEYPQYQIKTVQFYPEQGSGDDTEKNILDNWMDSLKVGRDNAKENGY